MHRSTDTDLQKEWIDAAAMIADNYSGSPGRIWKTRQFGPPKYAHHDIGQRPQAELGDRKMLTPVDRDHPSHGYTDNDAKEQPSQYFLLYHPRFQLSFELPADQC